jgi:hypothetical protein
MKKCCDLKVGLLVLLGVQDKDANLEVTLETRRGMKVINI